MNFDELMKDAWQAETRTTPAPDLARRVRRRRWRHRLRRGLEVALTLVAVLVFVPTLASGRMTPSHWLLMPFYLVFLPVVWVIVLRAQRRRVGDVSERLDAYARLRLSQLRTGLRDLWLARATAWALLGYSLLANLGVWVLADAHWRSAGLLLLALAIAGLVVTRLTSAVLRLRWLREYRAVRRLTGD